MDTVLSHFRRRSEVRLSAVSFRDVFLLAAASDSLMVAASDFLVAVSD